MTEKKILRLAVFDTTGTKRFREVLDVESLPGLPDLVALVMPEGERVILRLENLSVALGRIEIYNGILHGNAEPAPQWVDGIRDD